MKREVLGCGRRPEAKYTSSAAGNCRGAGRGASPGPGSGGRGTVLARRWWARARRCPLPMATAASEEARLEVLGSLLSASSFHAKAGCRECAAPAARPARGRSVPKPAATPAPAGPHGARWPALGWLVPGAVPALAASSNLLTTGFLRDNNGPALGCTGCVERCSAPAVAREARGAIPAANNGPTVAAVELAGAGAALVDGGAGLVPGAAATIAGGRVPGRRSWAGASPSATAELVVARAGAAAGRAKRATGAPTRAPDRCRK